MTKQQFAQITSGIQAFYGTFQLDITQMGLWYEMLEDLDYEICNKAIKKLIQTTKFAPTVADIRQAYTEIKNGDLPSLEQSINDMRLVASKYGRYRYDEGMEWLKTKNPTAYRILKAIGYNSYANNQEAYMQSTIAKLHKEIVENDAEVATLQTKFIAEIGAIKQQGLLMNVEDY